MYTIVSTIVSGLVVGFIASLIMGENGNLTRYILIGIVGSALGSMLCRIVGIFVYGRTIRLAINLAGSCLLIWLIHKMGYE